MLTHPVKFFLWEETGEPEKTHDFRQSVDRTLPTCDQMLDTGLEPMTSVVGGRRLDAEKRHWKPPTSCVATQEYGMGWNGMEIPPNL